MKTLPTVLIAVASAVGATVLYSALTQPSGADSNLDARLDALAKNVSDLQKQLADATAALSSNAAPSVADSSIQRSDVGGIDAAIARWMRENRPDLLGSAEDAGETIEGLSEAERREKLGSLMAELDQDGLSYDEYEEIWKRIREAGLMDDAIALLEEMAAADPMNPDLKVALASSYFQKINDVPNDMDKGVWAMKADGVLDRALELNPEHWDARFSKAVALSFWPPVMGKQSEAIRHFETLLDQQQGMVPQPGHAQTYLFLGNMHQQMGNHAAAAEIWESGLTTFPDDAALLEQLANSLED